MRCATSALSAVFLVTGHALAADPGPASPPPKPTPSSAGKATPSAAKPALAPGAAPTAAPQAAPGDPGDAPPPEYYVEPGSAAPERSASAPPLNAAPSAPPAPAGEPPPPPSAPPGPPPIYEPPPPGFYPGEPVFEPLPPPEPRHIAPHTALWLGVRLGWFIPFGSAWGRGSRDSQGNLSVTGVPWRDYVSSGPMFELDAGARLSRNYNVFALWEHAELGDGHGDPGTTAISAQAKGGDTDFWGVGLRATSDPDHVGFVTELAVGYRLARAKYHGGEIQFTDAPFEARLGIGADIRVNRLATLAPMLTLGVGSFGKIDRASGGTVTQHTGPDDQVAGHAWATLSVAGNFDLLGSKK